ncbi:MULTISPECIES: helix-turn-helix transcriptional regulator [unclassified Virgibacillus]|uniref:helix-turn-helix domain-containing protein n=1 Tax=unclassified Virgibacillus TaxID=2620237 RepID=UPI0024DE8A92|nr:helix-turn-helix transcriptional regulator [Virgibacillus sp. LDC-1]
MAYTQSELLFLKLVGDHLKFYRLEKGFTQEELSESAGFSRSYYTEIENGKRNVSILNLYKLASALNVPVKELINDANAEISPLKTK